MNKKVFWIISAISILALWLFQNATTVNIPWWDDFHGVILPVHDLFTNISFFDKFKSFVSLNNEHRVVNDRIFSLLIYLITGKFNLKILALLGFINLIGIFLILILVLKGKNKLALLPVLFLIFHAQYYESLQSLMVPFQNFSVLFYMAVSLYLITIKEKTKWAFVFAIAALLSHGNGILVFIIGAMVLLLNKKYRQLIGWFVLSLLAIFIYFIGYSKPSWTDTDVISPLQNPIAAIRYVFEFLGAYSLNYVEISDTLNSSVLRQLVPQLFGFIMVLLSGIMLYKIYLKRNEFLTLLRQDKTNQFIIGFSLFFLGTGMLMGLTRTGFPVLSRYTINSSMFLISIWMFYVVNFSKSKNLLFSFITLITLLLTYYNNIEKAVSFKNNLIADAFNYQNNGTWVNNYIDPAHVSRVNPLLIEPLKSNEYEFPPSVFDDYERWNSEVKNEILNFSILDPYLIISGTAKDNNNIFFSIESSNNTFIFPISQRKNNPIKLLKERSYYSKDYRTYFPFKVIPEGKYKIYKIEISSQKTLKYNLNRLLDTKGIIY